MYAVDWWVRLGGGGKVVKDVVCLSATTQHSTVATGVEGRMGSFSREVEYWLWWGSWLGGGVS